MYNKYFKRALDIIISLAGIPFFIFLLVPISILIKLEDRGSIFYNGLRIGRFGVPFTMYKFRTMKENSPDIRLPDGSTFNSKDDPRITRIGRFLRETSLDEIPQLFNILKGDMSLIGPRPDLNSNPNYPEETKAILEVRPGITGYTQAFYRNATDWHGKIVNDLWYVNNMSFTLDMRILFRTFVTVILRRKIYR